MTPSDAMHDEKVFVGLIEEAGGDATVAVKDVIDIKGFKTTGACRFMSDRAVAAERDADCLAGIRAANLPIIGKTNCNELAFGTEGMNSWTGTPRNPLGNELVPGGSSSGNAVALGTNKCAIAIGTDTGGSVRIPAACCGVAGLKTTYGRVSRSGVLPLAPSLDTVGPMARKVADLKRAFSLLGAIPAVGQAEIVAFQRLTFVDVAPEVESAISSALSMASIEAESSTIAESDWELAISAANDVLWAEASTSFQELRPFWPDLQVGKNLQVALSIAGDDDRMARARTFASLWRELLLSSIRDRGLIIAPTLQCLTPSFFELATKRIRLARFTSPVNLAGLPAVVIPIPSGRDIPASIQVIGPPDGEELLLDVAQRIEVAVEPR